MARREVSDDEGCVPYIRRIDEEKLDDAVREVPPGGEVGGG